MKNSYEITVITLDTDEGLVTQMGIGENLVTFSDDGKGNETGLVRIGIPLIDFTVKQITMLSLDNINTKHRLIYTRLDDGWQEEKSIGPAYLNLGYNTSEETFSDYFMEALVEFAKSQ